MSILNIHLMHLSLVLRILQMTHINMQREEQFNAPLGFDMKLRQPLDFYAVTDHGFFMGMMPAWADPNSKPGQHPCIKTLHNVNGKEFNCPAI